MCGFGHGIVIFVRVVVSYVNALVSVLGALGRARGLRTRFPVSTILLEVPSRRAGRVVVMFILVIGSGANVVLQ